MKIFISQDMRYRTDEEIQEERQKAMKLIRGIYPDCEFIDSYILNALNSPENVKKPLWWIGMSLMMLSEADMCFFVNDCMNDNRGCTMEYIACQSYNIPRAKVYTDTNTDTNIVTIEVR